MKKDKKLVIIGAGYFSEIAYEYFQYDSEYEVTGFAVNSNLRNKDKLFSLPVVDLENIEQHFPNDQYHIYTAITFSSLNKAREGVYQNLKNRGYKFANYISSRAFVWRNVEMGENNFIFENNVIQPFVKIGNNNIFWSGNHIGHHTTIHNNCFISSHVVVSGHCEVGSNVFMGVNSCVADETKIADFNFISMASAITKSTESDGVYRGNPAEKLKISAKKFFKVKE